jgi:hypothetical protein
MQNSRQRPMQITVTLPRTVERLNELQAMKGELSRLIDETTLKIAEVDGAMNEALKTELEWQAVEAIVAVCTTWFVWYPREPSNV